MEWIADDAAYRGHARVFLKDLEAVRPSAIVDIIHSGESFVLEQTVQKSIKPLRESTTSLCALSLPLRNLLAMRLHVL